MKEVSTPTTLNKDQYCAIMDKTGEHLIAFVTPAKGVQVNHFVEQMQAKGINLVVRDKDTTERSFEL